MAGTDPKRQLLNLIRDVASEKSQGEIRVVGLKSRIEELRLELEAANAEREEAKRFKETIEQELKGYEVELALNDNSFHALESRISSIQDDISAVGSDVENLKKEEADLRDGFISQMLEFNNKIREFHMTVACNFRKDNCLGTAAEVDHNFSKKEDTEVALETLENKLADIVSQTAKAEEAHQKEGNINKQVQLELADFERKVSLMEAIVTETKALQELTRQTSEMEKTIASLTEELQERCICPSCHRENVEALGGILHANQEN
ncbi:paramyosin [Pistacia vera]|uniref:paramyosin n=1 Tax=Pistacia vera TaxID=55513 RepID=UPI0012637983|nr:paramyosin [Pistacia vera]